MKNKSLLLYFFISSFLFAQNQKTDSLSNLIKTDKEDTTKDIHLYRLCREYILINEFDTALIFGKQSLALAQSLGFKKGMAYSYNNLGLVYYDIGNYPEALKMHTAALKVRQEINDKQGTSASYNNIGLIYDAQGNYPLALQNHFAALKIREQINDKQGIATSYNNVAIIYMYQGNYPLSLQNYVASLKLFQQIKDAPNIATAFHNIALIYYLQGKLALALQNHFAGLKMYQQIKNQQGIAYSYNNIGNIYYAQGNYPLALQNYFAGLKIQQELEDKEGIAASYINLGQIYTKQNKTPEAQTCLNKALQLGQEIGSKDVMKDCYVNLITLDSTIGNYKAAFQYQKLFVIYRDSLDNEETKKQSLQTSMQYEFDKKEIAAKAAQDKLDVIHAEEKQKQRIIIYAVVGLLLLVAIFAIFMYNRFRITNKQKVIIEKQKQRVDRAYEQLHEKNKEVMDSIHYAKRIQRALITPEKYIANSLKKLMKDE